MSTNKGLVAHVKWTEYRGTLRPWFSIRKFFGGAFKWIP